MPTDKPGWYQSYLRRVYWLRAHDRKYFGAVLHGGDYIEFFKKYLDLKTPLQRDAVGMNRPFQFGINELYVKDVEERRGSTYIDDDLSGEFVVDLPNGRYDLLLGVGYGGPSYGGGESAKYHMAVEGRVRKKGLGPYWRRTRMHRIRNVTVTDGQLNIRFFCDVRRAMDTYSNWKIGIGWMINYLLVLPAERKELLGQWEWKIIRRRGEVIRRVTFVEGDPAWTGTGVGGAKFLAANGKPLYFVKLQNNYIPGTTEHFGYYSLCNVLHAYQTVSGSQHFFKPDWEKFSYSDDYPWRTIDRMNVTYTWRYLTSMHQEGILSFVPRAVAGEGNPTVDARGRINRYNIQPPLNSALGKEIQKEAYTMISNQLREHPAMGLHYIYEELWHPNEAGYDDQSLIEYRAWLRRKYGTVGALNAEWGRKYTSFDDIVQPRRGKNSFWEFTPEFINFRTFRSWAQRQMVRGACGLVRRLEPNHVSWAAKGDYGTQSWHTGEFLDMFGWYTPYVAAGVARHFGKVAVVGGYQLNTEHAYVDGRRQFDHKPGKRRYLGRHEERTTYNRIVSSVFKGTKGFYVEWYSSGLCHAFQRTAYLRDAGPKYKIKRWTGEIAFFEPQAYQGPPVNLNRSALYAGRANQMLYRLGHLWLPAAPLKPKVLFPVTESSCCLGFFGRKPYADFEPVQMRILKSCNVAADFVDFPAVKDLSQYDLVVLSDLSACIRRSDAERIRRFVAGGGKLIVLNEGGFADDARPRRYAGHRGKDEIYPLAELADLGGYRLVARDWYHPTLGKVAVSFAANDVAPQLADGRTIGTWPIDFHYRPLAGSTVFLKGVFQKDSRFAKPGREVALGILNRQRNVAVVSVPPEGSGEEVVRPFARWFRGLIDTWGIDGRVSLAGLDDAWDTYAGTLTGDGYTLAAFCNLDPNQPRKATLKLKGLAAGPYAVIDVTGDRPDLRKAPDGGWRLKSAPAERQLKIDHRMTGRQIAERGIPCEAAPKQAQVWLLRPTSRTVWVSIWPPALGGFTRHPVTVAYGTAAEDKAGAEALRAALAARGVKVELTPAAKVKRKKLHHEVRIKPTGSNQSPRDDPSKWYLVDVFDNEVIDTDRSVIVVGSQRTNSLMKHLCGEGTFAYDKVLEKITPEYPGPGRGVICWLDAVNSARYDLRSQARDAILVGGSDAAGTRAAVARLAELIARHGTPLAPPRGPDGPTSAPRDEPDAEKE